MTQPMATVMPPKAIMIFGPRCGPRTSTIHPSIGVSQVSSAMKIEKANWIDAIDQPWALFIGLTNSVQPYCRLAIIIMQTTQIARKPQRNPETPSARTTFDAVVITFPPGDAFSRYPHNDLYLWDAVCLDFAMLSLKCLLSAILDRLSIMCALRD